MTLLQWFLLPLFLQVVLTLVMGLFSLNARVRAVRSGRVKLPRIALDNSAWPADVRRFGNNFDNQFQMPMLAFTGAGLIVATNMVDKVTIIAGWVFLAFRLLHAFEHVGSNIVPRRTLYYLGSFLAVTVMWLWFAVRLFAIG